MLGGNDEEGESRFISSIAYQPRFDPPRAWTFCVYSSRNTEIRVIPRADAPLNSSELGVLGCILYQDFEGIYEELPNLETA